MLPQLPNCLGEAAAAPVAGAAWIHGSVAQVPKFVPGTWAVHKAI